MKTWLLALCSLVLVLSSSLALASDKAAAESLFRAGKALMEEGKYEEACAKFEASMTAEESVGALLNLALCHEKVGRTATAWAEFIEAAAMAERADQSDRAEGARTFAKRLEARLSHLTIEVPEPVAGLVVTRDGEPLPEPTWGTKVPIDPGEHTIAASAPGHETWTTTITIGEADAQQLAVPTLPVGTSAEARSPGADGGASGWVIAGYTTAGIGLAVLGVGVGLGVKATSDRDDLERTDCVNFQCTPDGLTRLDGIQALADGATAAIVIGSVGLVGGITMVLAAPDADDDGPEAALSVGPGSLSIRGRF